MKAGGTFITTYWSGIVDENDLVFLGGFPGPLRAVTGVWSEEIDALYDSEYNIVKPIEGNPLELKSDYKAEVLCDLIHAENAKVLMTYKTDFYANRPALTENTYGEGKAYYMEREFVFLMNFSKDVKKIDLGLQSLKDLVSNEVHSADMILNPYGVAILEKI